MLSPSEVDAPSLHDALPILAVINSVQEGLAKELDIQAIYDLVGDRIRELFDAQVVGIATFDHDKDEEHIQYVRSEEHTSELQSPCNLVCRLLLAKKKQTYHV